MWASLAFALGWAILMRLRLTTGATDVPHYFAYGEAMRRGLVPYRDFAVEYPPGALAAFGLPALVATTHHGYRVAFELVMGLAGIVVVVATAVTLDSLRLRARWRLLFVGAAVLILGPITLGHFDLFPAALVAASFAALLSSRPRLAGVLLGLAIAVKIYAVVFVPLVVVWLWRRDSRAARRWTLGASVAVVLCFLPFAIVSPGGLLDSLQGQLNRPLQIESSAAAVLLAAHQLFSFPIGVAFSHTSVNLGGGRATAAATASTVAEIALLLLLWIEFGRKRPQAADLMRFSTAALLTFVVLGKVLSPQFMLWLIPMVVLLDGALGLVGPIGVGLAVVLTRLYFPRHWPAIVQLHSTATWYLIARDAVLLGLLVVIVATIFRRPAAARYRVPSATSQVAGTPRRM